MSRDFTYIDDIVKGIVAVLKKTPPQNELYRIFNIGNNKPITLKEYISIIEEILQKEALKDYLPMQPGDMLATYADTSLIEKIAGFKPDTSIQKGMSIFIDWYKKYYRQNT